MNVSKHTGGAQGRNDTWLKKEHCRQHQHSTFNKIHKTQNFQLSVPTQGVKYISHAWRRCCTCSKILTIKVQTGLYLQRLLFTHTTSCKWFVKKLFICSGVYKFAVHMLLIFLSDLIQYTSRTRSGGYDSVQLCVDFLLNALKYTTERGELCRHTHTILQKCNMYCASQSLSFQHARVLVPIFVPRPSVDIQ